ncbi:hypothetical protein B1R32_1415 [Abditibacterium utsteinense]|uniref:Uncharacterized protein n=1 Tax=Abditibacterium utsteinense TaxID=1960156 RepID=A0A2S8SNM1_9BACT|nr:hypothetical protein [Abditibacterium utsteinense]PQV62395.1 hypothetical protein B1R32_1415 [Abditibacterium utsteinense]
MSSIIVKRPNLPPGISYRQDLMMAVWILFVAELGLTAHLLVFLDWFKTAPWMLCLPVSLSLAVFLIWLRRFLWLEKQGWWSHSPVSAPALPVRFSGLGYETIFDAVGIHVSSNFGQRKRSLAYDYIVRVDATIRDRSGGRQLLLIESGVVPLEIASIKDNDIMSVVALLGFYAPQTKFCGFLLPMHEGWRPRSFFDFS